ncbi:hypothetical protein IU418_13395 [Nocardia farcinica]|uniref:hypothetical protein n=1 Tax=Nocardia farcinica TaxID=37329 RepID=UPI001B3C5E00|nr:hypothetical protein [Nocardia farcinica]MBF6538199.1 hypothetical protein [Nocardia farcinica]
MPDYRVYLINTTSTDVNVNGVANAMDAAQAATDLVHAPLCHACSHEREDGDWEPMSVEDIATGDIVLDLDDLSRAAARVAELENRVAELEAKRSTLGYAAVDLRACDRRPQPVLLGPWDDEKSVREAWGDTEGVVLTELSVLPTEKGQTDA